MDIKDIIIKKRKKEMLSEEEIRYFIFGYFNDEILDCQAAALITAMDIYGINENEMIYMINTMAQTGEKMDFYKISSKLTDVHSLGGISDKIILIILAIIDAIELPAAKVIGRELGMEDRLISLEGYKLENKIENFKQDILNGNIGILKSLKNLAPIEKKFYNLRYKIACTNNVEFVAMSIMSQKVALGFSNVFFEITYGKNAYVKTLADAKLLARYLKNIGKKMKINTACAISCLNQPIGKTFGNILELREIYEILNGNMSEDIKKLIYNYVCDILVTSKACLDKNKCKALIESVISKGEALESFKKMLVKKGGRIEIIQKDIKTKNMVPIISMKEGYIQEIDVSKIRSLAKYIDAIRTCTLDKIDVGAGIVFNKKVGDKIEVDEVLGYIYTNNETRVEDALKYASEAFIISPKKIHYK